MATEPVDQPIPSPLQAQAAQWMAILATHYPAHTLTQIVQEVDADEPDNITLRVKLTPTVALSQPSDPNEPPQPDPPSQTGPVQPLP